MTRTQKSQVIHRYFDEVWTAGRLDVLGQIIHPSYVNHAPGLPDMPPGPEGLKPIVAAMRCGLPDLRYEILHEIHEGDLVCVRTMVRGTNLGELFGRPPSGRAIEVEQMQIERFQEGLIVEHWRRTDEGKLAQQLGWTL